MNFKTFKITALTLTLAANATLAIAESSRSDEYQNCMDRINDDEFRRYQFMDCVTEELTRQDAILNTEYKILKNSLSEEQKNQLVKAQRAWLKYREDWCRFDENGLQAPGGSINYTLCLLDITDVQIDLIKNQQY